MNQEISSQDIIDKWCAMEEQADVAFISAPITYPPIPSMALSIFQATLDAAGISSKVIYTMFLSMHLLGNDRITRLQNTIQLSANGDLLFAHLTDVPTPCQAGDYASLLLDGKPDDFIKEITGLLEQGKAAAESIVDATARRIVHMKARIAAASSIYAQQNASLAILRRVKELDPSITTIIGGFNVSGEAGMAILRNYPSVDYVSFGEGDETIAEVCRNILNKSEAPMPYGIVGRSDPLPDPIPYRITKDMNTVMMPEYRDYFEEKEKAIHGFYGDIFKNTGIRLDTIVFLEGSRGCWWAQRKACSFCGLNGLSHVYREKTAEHFYEEIRETMRRFPGARIQLSDNVLSRNMIQNLLPMMAEDQESYHVLAEIKANLKAADMEMLAKAGFDIVQPGIESLNDHLLELMGKGCTAIQNIAILKYARNYKIYPAWNMLCAIPGEDRTDYEQILSLIPLLHHLPSPSLTGPIMFTRFSRYCNSPEEFGLELGPKKINHLSYQGNEDLIQNMGANLSLIGGTFFDIKKQNQELYQRLDDATAEWRKLSFQTPRPSLYMVKTILGLMILDSRPAAPAPRVYLTGLRARIYSLAWEPVSLQNIYKALPDDPKEDIQSCLNDLVSRKLMIFLSNRYLALATMPN